MCQVHGAMASSVWAISSRSKLRMSAAQALDALKCRPNSALETWRISILNFPQACSIPQLITVSLHAWTIECIEDAPYPIFGFHRCNQGLKCHILARE